MPLGRRLNPPLLMAAAIGLLFVVVTTWITWMKHDTYNSGTVDLAMYTQLVWNMAQGYPFETSLLSANRMHLAEHLALSLLPLAPLYGLGPDVKLLLLLQQTALAASGLAVYWLARRKLGSIAAVVLMGGYYAMPLLAEIAFDAFYPITFAAIPIGWAAALALLGRVQPAMLLVLAAALMEEEATLLTLGVGLYLLLAQRRWRWQCAALLLAGATWIGVGTLLIMPSFHEPSTSGDETRIESHYDNARSAPLSWSLVVAASRLEPDGLRAVGWLRPFGLPQPCAYSLPGQCAALRWWVYPTAGLTLLSPSTLVMAAPPAAAFLLADKPGRFRRHWVAPMLPVVWLATVAGLAGLTRRTFRLAGLAAVLIASVAMYRLDGTLPLGGRYTPSEIAPSRTGSDLRRLGREIPDDASVAASLRTLAHLANRRELYALPREFYARGLRRQAEPPRYALVDLEQDGEHVGEVERLTRALPLASRYREINRTRSALLLGRSEP